MQAVHEIASRPAPAENLPTPTAPPRRGRPPRQPQPAPRKAQARRARTDSKPAAKRLERGSNARFVEETLRARAPLAVRPAEIRAALQHDKGVLLAFTSIRHALGQLEARKAVEQDGGWWLADRLMIERLRFHCGTATASEAYHARILVRPERYRRAAASRVFSPAGVTRSCPGRRALLFDAAEPDQQYSRCVLRFPAHPARRPCSATMAV